ncbi:putative integral membrane protein [Kibdelosporangium banguiense]|uniref:Integral membrane protein n=1 Tax=Kibdelosporangium banguiense TaxID=1365924 RepID=A0ABS4TZJ6_9PSEU|nr:lipopolysaccharide assembly protein LapA domain-containing protein [Kibdelosporangium banguiense]MBP2329836.1 putative integral membrane protein [Kibdelosporangium banguiense]
MTSQPHESPPTDEIPVAEPPPAPGVSPIKRTRISGTWIAVIVAAVLMIFLLVFILENLTTVTVGFLGMEGNLPLGVALLFAAISGALLVALVGGARILQIRHRVRRSDKG